MYACFFTTRYFYYIQSLFNKALRTYRTKNILVQHICAFVEVASGTLAALLVLPPTGTIALHVCSPKALSDWYTLLHNPQPDYKETLHCTQEAVYPLYVYFYVDSPNIVSLQYIFYSFLLITK